MDWDMYDSNTNVRGGRSIAAGTPGGEGRNGIGVPALLPTAWRRQPTAVCAQLGYVRSASARPVSYMYDPPDGTLKDNCDYDFRELLIADARSLAGTTSVHQEGFELWRAPSAVTDFHDAQELSQTYHAECQELACEVTGGTSAFVFDHQLRKREQGRPPLTFGRSGDGRQPGGVGRVHNDYSEASGRRRLGLVLRDPERAKWIGRYCIVNIWRSIKGPILDTPLAVCDARTVAARDLVTGEIRYPDRIGEIYVFEHSDRHRWHYYSEMDCSEALVFKQYDSQVSGVSRFTPHAAFDLPNIPADAPLRESIEVRCLVLFE
jgi:hypothetical protein